MTRRPTALPEHIRPTAEEMQKGIARIERRLEKLKELDPTAIQTRDDPTVGVLEKSIEQALIDTFGAQSNDYNRYSGATLLDTASWNLNYATPIAEVRNGLEIGKARAIALLTQAIEALRERIVDTQPLGSTAMQVPTSNARRTRKIFVVHGHDHGPKEAVARYLEKIGFEPVILHEQPNQGRTIIEKFEAHSDVSFAVVILSPDDTTDTGAKRARQNVILELGYFIGRLTRARVCALKKGEIEPPSDILGVLWTAFDDSGSWKAELAKELEAAEFEIDWNKVMR